MGGLRRRLRNEIDDFFESEGYYRKLIPRESNSLYLALSDLLYENQKQAQVLEKEVAYEKSEEGSPYEEIEFISFKLGIKIQVVEAPNFSNMPTFGPESDESFLLCCYKTPRHFDAVFSCSKIQNMGFAQSILYKLLYESVFKLEFTMEAASLMLTEESKNKPIVYDKTFSGTALEALDHQLIPFPYKVAKALDPFIYRNIDFDVWFNKFGGQSSSPKVLCSSCEASGRNLGMWIGTPNKEKPNSKSSSYILTRLARTEHSESKKKQSGDKPGGWVQNFDFSVPPPTISDSSKFIVKSIYPILGDCPVPSEGCGQEGDRKEKNSSNKPPPLTIPHSINSIYPVILSPILSPSPVLTLSPCSSEMGCSPGGVCSYFVWPTFY